ncbi:MAG: hypothetical protein IKL14_05015 [Alphaproteobacteria bacterium]|nr:hypothetical protein [Alphaproteobacteria bacterium]
MFIGIPSIFALYAMADNESCFAFSATCGGEIYFDTSSTNAKQNIPNQK